MKTISIGNIYKYLPILLCGAIAAYVLFFSLGKPALDNWDEAWYGEVAKQIISTDNYIKLTWNGANFVDKPPLYMWLVVLVSKIAGRISEFTVRFPSAVAGLITVVLVYWYSEKKYGIISAMVAFGSLILNNLYIWRTRSGNLDVLTTLWIVIIYFLLNSKMRLKYPLIGLFLALTFITKAAIVALPLSVVAIAIIFMDKNKTKSDYLEYIKMFIMFAFPIVLWLYFADRQMGIEYVKYFVFSSDQDVARLTFANFNFSYFTYIYYSLQRRLTYLLFFGIASAILYIRNKENKLLVLFAIPFVLALSFSRRTNNWYLIPVFPFLSILIAQGVSFIFKLSRENIVIKIGLVTVCSYIFYKAYTVNIIPIMDTYSSNSQRESGQLISKLSAPEDVIIRLDELYPSTIYYTNRKVLVHEANQATGWVYISRIDLDKQLEGGSIKWFSGTSDKIEEFAKTINYPYDILTVNKNESILKIK